MQVTRRKAIIGGATLTTGGVYAILNSTEAAAEITIDEYSISDIEQETGDYSEIMLETTADINFQATQEVELIITSEIGRDTVSMYEVDSKRYNTDSVDESITLSGDILETGAFDTSMFDSETEQTAVAALKAEVFDGEERIEAAIERTEFTITMVNGELTVTADISGSGTLTFN